MRTSTAAIACFVCLLAGAGCYESLSSIVTPDKLVYDDDLVGDYNAVDPATGRVTLARAADGKSYAFKQYDEQGVLQSDGTLKIVKLGDEHLYELSADSFKTVDGKPLYVIGRLVIGGPRGAKTLTNFGFKSRETLFDGPDVTTAEYTTERDGERQTGRLLSMPTE